METRDISARTSHIEANDWPVSDSLLGLGGSLTEAYDSASWSTQDCLGAIELIDPGEASITLHEKHFHIRDLRVKAFDESVQVSVNMRV